MITFSYKEHELEAYLLKFSHALGYKCLKLTGEVGIPDRLIIGKHGCSMYAELKRSHNAAISAAQEACLEDLVSRGMFAYRLNNKEEVRKALYELTMRDRNAKALKESINQMET